jgi:Flp pilus assembly CpaE family ATPase
MTKTLKVLLIEDSTDYAALVQQWLSTRTDITFVLDWATSLAAGLTRLKKGGIDVILLDLGLPDSEGLETFTRVNVVGSGVPVILLSGDDDEKLALQTVLDGAQDFIFKRSCTSDSLAKAIQYAVVRATNQIVSVEAVLPPGKATIIGVMGVKGGVGSTTIACNLAVELHRQTGAKTLLADLDLDGGMVGFLMNANSEYSVLDAVRNVDRLDLSFWEGLLDRRGGLDVLRSPSSPGVADPDAAALQHVLSMIRREYGWVVVDLGRPAGFSLSLLESVSELLLVTTTSIPSLYEAKRAIAELRITGFDGDRLKVVVNQLSKAQDFSNNDLDRLLGIPPYARISDASLELHEACVKRVPPAIGGPFRTQLAALARQLAGLPPEKAKSGVSNMFSFLSKPPGAAKPPALPKPPALTKPPVVRV